MGNNRTAVLTSLALFAACSGKLSTGDGTGSGDPTLGTTGTQPNISLVLALRQDGWIFTARSQ